MTRQINDFWQEYHLAIKALISFLVMLVLWFAGNKLEGMEHSLDRMADSMQKYQMISVENRVRLEACERAIKECDK